MKTIAFIGLGTMGGPMATHLADAGYQIITKTHNSPLPAKIEAKGIKAVASLSQAAAEADIIITMLPDTPQVETVLFGSDGIAEGLSKGKIVIDMSSISPIETKAFAKQIEALGCEYVDAPVSGGEVGAKNASLTIMCGGKEAVSEKVKPLFELMGKNITLVGGSGDGQTCKVANQIIVALNIQAVSEALVFAKSAGADPAKVREALMGGFASSKILEVHGERMIKRTFDPGFRIKLHQKDLGLALSGAKALNVALPNTANCQQMMNVCESLELADSDHSALVQAIEHLSNQKLC